MLKLKFIRNRVTLSIFNNLQETAMFEPKEMIGILDLRLLGYCMIRQGVLQHTFNKYYQLESSGVLCK